MIGHSVASTLGHFHLLSTETRRSTRLFIHRKAYVSIHCSSGRDKSAFGLDDRLRPLKAGRIVSYSPEARGSDLPEVARMDS